MELNSLVSIVIPTHNRREKIIRLIDSIKRCKYPQSKIEIIIVDDASTDNTLEAVQKLFSDIKVLRNNVELFPSACRNLGIMSSRGNYIFLIDDDNVLDRTAISELVKIFARYKDVGLAGPIAYYYKNPEKIWCAGGKLSLPILIPWYISQGETVQEFSEKWVIECDYVPNAFMINKEIVSCIGLFDERLPIGWEEADLALRIKKRGYRVVVSTAAKIFHDVPMTWDFHITERRAYWRGRSRVLFCRKHVPIRRFLIIIDILGFMILLLKLNKRMEKYLPQYIKGIKNGLAYNFNS